MVTLFFKIFETGHLSAMTIKRSLCSAEISDEKASVLEMVVSNSPLLSCVIFNEILISGISQPFRSMYIRKVDKVHPANEAKSVEYGSGPKSLPPMLSGSSMSNVPLRQEMVHKYFCVPIFPVISFSKRLSMVIKRPEIQQLYQRRFWQTDKAE